MTQYSPQDTTLCLEDTESVTLALFFFPWVETFLIGSGYFVFLGLPVMMHLSHQRAPKEFRPELCGPPSFCHGWKFHL